jgi:hypothetical protein
MDLYPTNRSALSLSAAAFRLTVLALCLSASASALAQLTQSQQTTVTNLQQTSLAIKSQVTLGTAYSSGLSAAANAGTIVDPQAYTQATLTEAQRTAYNSALTAFSSTNFYSAAQFFQDRANATKTQMQAAIADLATATVDLQKVVAVNQTVANITDPQTARAAQQTIQNAGLGTSVTSEQMAAYNSSLADVNSYASQTASFMRAANSASISGNVDTFAAQYGRDLSYATATVNYANSSVTVAWGELVLTQQGVLSPYKQSAEAFFNTVSGGK